MVGCGLATPQDAFLEFLQSQRTEGAQLTHCYRTGREVNMLIWTIP